MMYADRKRKSEQQRRHQRRRPARRVAPDAALAPHQRTERLQLLPRLAPRQRRARKVQVQLRPARKEGLWEGRGVSD